jgi:4-hydroxy-L-threonine phosphate dehydrogenase PdxA
MSDTSPPLMALTLGDPAGVGPEIVLNAAADPETFRLYRPLTVDLLLEAIPWGC